MECHNPPSHDQCKPRGGFDLILHGSSAVLVIGLAAHFLPAELKYLSSFGHAVYSLILTMWWGIVLGIFAVGIMSHIPREYFQSLFGNAQSINGLARAALAGLLLDLCSHGILMVGAKLYERGVSLAQIITFLIASPWNSLTLTIILFSLIGAKWTLLFIAGSVVIAMTTGYLFLLLTKKGVVESNPNQVKPDKNFNLKKDMKERLSKFKPTKKFWVGTVKTGWKEGKMVVRWLLLGIVLAALIRTFVSTDVLSDYFGPTLLGLGLTIIATTIIEVCSEGSAPIGAELVNRAGAPGNGFAFLMAGVSTDYTEILVLRQFTGRWKTAFLLPVLSVPQIILLGYIMNIAGS
jgi:uncharacterized membrane protein YraQ (UPF0718 family)